MPTYALTRDPNIEISPESFDALRHYKKRQTSPAEANKHQFSSIDKDTLHFGYGRHSCPGRLFASNSVKMILILFLTKFQLKLREGETRPKNKTHDELVFPDFATRVLLREQEKNAS